MGRIKVFTDGASRGNPGDSGIGIVIYDENDFIIHSHKEYIGESTNNRAEYRAILKSLEIIKKLRADGGSSIEAVDFYSDSELMVNQINFDYMARDAELSLLNNKFHVLIKKLNIPYTVTHIERSKNKSADRLANLAIDRKVKQG